MSEMKMDRSSLDLGMAGISGKVGIFMAMSPKISPIVIIGERFQQETFFRNSRKKHVDLLLNMKLSPCFTNKDGDFLSCGWETLSSSLAPHLIGNMNTHSSLAPLDFRLFGFVPSVVGHARDQLIRIPCTHSAQFAKN